MAGLLEGLLVKVPSLVKDLGTNSTGAKPVTDGNSFAIVGATQQSSGSIWDKLGSGLGAILDNDVLKRYVDGKVTKELMKDGVPLYTTYGNPSDQAGGKLLADIAIEQENQNRKYWLIGAGVLGVIGIGLIFVSRK